MKYSSFDAEPRSLLIDMQHHADISRVRDGDLLTLAKQLTRLAENRPFATGVTDRVVPRVVDGPIIRKIIKARRLREHFFPAELFADAVWDMMLDLTASKLENKLTSVSSLCLAANVPTTTALRTIKGLVECGVFERSSDPLDGRRTYITLNEPNYEAMLACVAEMIETLSVRNCSQQLSPLVDTAV